MIRTFLADPVGDRSQVPVSGEEYKYLSRVRRLGVGARLEVRDSAGKRFLAVFESAGSRQGLLRILEELEPPSDSWPVRLITAVPKRNLLEAVLRQVSELGVELVRPIMAHRSTLNPGEGRQERWQRVAAESLRQCGRGNPLEVASLADFESALKAEEHSERRLILAFGEEYRGLGEALAEPSKGGTALAVGPEGGFTDEELDTAGELGFEPVGAGDLIMRTETAGVVACAMAVASLGGLGTKIRKSN